MQIGSTLPCQSLNLFQTKRASFRCNGSPLNPSTNPRSSIESMKIHLSNLDKLLQKQSIPENQHQPIINHEEKLNHKAPFEGLNLNGIWPEMKSAEEMSPRNLNRLKRLLSMKAEYSPRNSLASRWREYHGSKDWVGLLDPLDENLRRELVRYGEFVQAAYHGFHSDPAMSAKKAPEHRHVALPDKAYKVTKSLYATSSVGLPKWVDDVAPDLGWMTQRTSWAGYVAVCEDPHEIQRMGRRDIVIALRGTATCLEWAENMRDLLVHVPGQNGSDPEHGQPKVECGFLSLYRTHGAHVPSLAESVVQEVKRLMEMYKGEMLSITITGHSLGAALSLLVADDLSTCTSDVPPIAVISFGGPRVGNHGFANRLIAKNVKVLRVVNSQDVITRVPGMFVSEHLDHKLRNKGTAKAVLNMLDNHMPWAYSHVGTELRVDTKKSPFLKPNADVACCHDLEAYLHLVDGFSASNCPFRANAKRSLVKLLNEQRSNVKKLYTSRAKALSINLDKQDVYKNNYLPSPS